MTQVVRGKAHGKVIELDRDLGLAEGQEVEVQVIAVPKQGQWGEGIRRSAGAWADHPELDATMEQIQQDRMLERRPHDAG